MTAAVKVQIAPVSDEERVARMRAIVGTPDPAYAAFPQAVRKVVFAAHAAHVQPLIEQHWPQSLQERAGKKLHFLTCNLYATSPYTVLFAAQNPPWPIRWARACATKLPLTPVQFSRLAAVTVGATSKVLDASLQRRVVQTAAFIATIDHVYDHFHTDAPPATRAAQMHAVLDGGPVPEGNPQEAGAFRLVRALFEAMQDGLKEDVDRAHFQQVVRKLRAYVDAERDAMMGVPDPAGRAWRMPGVEGTIDGLILPVHHFCNEQTRAWMYDVSLFVQVLDDYLDANKDAGELRPTPVLEGTWDETTLAATWKATVEGIVALARASGIHNEAYLGFVRETYRSMAIETAEAMAGGGAA
jgi:hypothetical protein